MLHWIIDIFFLLLLAGCAWSGYKKGFISGILGVCALIVAFYAANLLSATYSGEFTGMLEPFVSGIVDNATEKAKDSFEAAGTTPGVYDMALETLRDMGVMKSAGKNIATALAEEVSETGHVLRNAMVARLCVEAAYVLMLTILFVLFAIVFAVIGNIINLSFMLPGLELINGLLGTLFGVAKGLIFAFSIAWLLRFTGLALKEAVVDQTLLLRLLMNANPLTGIFGL